MRESIRDIRRLFMVYDGGVVPTPAPILPVVAEGGRVSMRVLEHRLEKRTALAIRVDLCSLDIRQRATECVTENVSSHGARVVSSKPWKPDERLNVWSSVGDFRARARVVYCEPRGASSYAIGLRLLASAGGWK